MEGPDDNIHMEISMCFPSNATNRVIMSAQYGKNRYQEIAKIPFHAGTRIVACRIEWHLKAIVTFLNSPYVWLI